MDPINVEKLQAMKRYRRKSFFFLLRKLVIYALEILIMGLFLSSPLWIPKVVSAIKYFDLVFPADVCAAVLGPKCVFLVCNIIVVLLVSESKRSGSMLQAVDIYDEYVEHSKRVRKTPTSNNGTKEMEEVALGEGIANGKEVEEEDEEEEEEEESDEEEPLSEECVSVADEDGGLPVEELNKRVEDFIARVKEQRRIEARSMMVM